MIEQTPSLTGLAIILQLAAPILTEVLTSGILISALLNSLFFVNTVYG
jgi:hypothetical protein